MAQVRPAQPVSAIYGRLGNVSLRRSRSAPFPVIDAPPLPTPSTAHPTSRISVVSVRRSRRPPRTQAQQRASGEARAVAASWRALSDAQRQAWETKAATLQLTENPATTGQWCGWALYSAVHRRFLLAEATPPTVPDAIAGIRVDRPWIKAWAHTTPGQIRVFWEPVSSPFPPPDSVGCLYASPPHPAARAARSGRARFLAAFDPEFTLPASSALTLTVADPSVTPPGAVYDLKASTATPGGEASATWTGQVKAPPPGWAVAFIWWTWNTFGGGNGIALGADRLLKVWDFDYPTATPATLDVEDPGVDLSDVLAFLVSNSVFTDTYVVDGSLLSAPASVLPPIRQHRRSHQQGAFSFFAPT